MVRKIKQGYLCEVCKFVYNDTKTAKACENYDKKYNSCNILLTRHAIGVINGDSFKAFKH